MSTRPARSRGPRVFVSYRREDASGHAGRIHDALLDAFPAENVFMDVDTIAPGSDFTVAIQEAVAACDVLIAVIGPTWALLQDSSGRRRIEDPNDFVHLEVAAALERGVPVIPALVQGASMPRQEDLPPALQPLARRQALEMSHERWQYDASRLVSVVRRIHTGTVRPGRISKPGGGPRRRPSGPIAIAAGLLGVAILGGVGVAGALMSRGGEEPRSSTSASQAASGVVTARPSASLSPPASQGPSLGPSPAGTIGGGPAPSVDPPSGSLAFQEDFDEDPTWTVEGFGAIAVVDAGALQVRVPSTGFDALVIFDEASEVSEAPSVSVEVIARRLTDNPGAAGYGIVCRYADAENYYALVMDDQGFWNIDRVVGGVPTTLNSYLVDDPGIRDRAFTIRGDCTETGDAVELALWIDGRLIATARDEVDPPPAGHVGFAFYNLHGWEGDLEARFEQVRVWIR